jgi:uncharacterized protein
VSRRLIALAALFPLLVAAGAGAEPLDRIPNPRTRDGTWVTDMPGRLRPDTVARLNATIGEFERTNGAEMAVVVIRSLDGLSIDEAAVRLFERWGVGKKSKDNGLLVFWAIDDRRVRVEVGYGLEGVLNDGKVGAILDAYVIPKFKAGEFDEGVLAGVDALLTAAREEPLELPSQRTETYQDGSPVIGTMVLGVLGLLPLSVASLVGFRKWRRYHRRRCPACQMPMTRLGDSQDNAFLADGQQAEERIKSVDYDVWKCGSCGHHFTLRYPKWMTSYASCPQCHHRTKSSAEKTIVAATTASSGTAQVIETCAFCTFHQEHTKTLPRIQPNSSSSGGSSGGGSSSFGGGRSGGGGASRGY